MAISDPNLKCGSCGICGVCKYLFTLNGPKPAISSQCKHQRPITGPSSPDKGKFVALGKILYPKEYSPSQRPQAALLVKWEGNAQKVDKSRPLSECIPLKKFIVGSNQHVDAGKDMGLFATILTAYNNHWILKTSPDDWWTTIIQTISIAIQQNSADASLKDFLNA